MARALLVAALSLSASGVHAVMPFCDDLTTASVDVFEAADCVRCTDEAGEPLEPDEDGYLHRTTEQRSELLVAASQLGWRRTVGALIAAGVEIDHRDDRAEFSVTPLFVAAWCGHAAVVRLLLDAGADPNAPSSLPFRGRLSPVTATPLDAAVEGPDFEGGDAMIQRMLRDAGAQPRHTEATGAGAGDPWMSLPPD